MTGRYVVGVSVEVLVLGASVRQYVDLEPDQSGRIAEFDETNQPTRRERPKLGSREFQAKDRLSIQARCECSDIPLNWIR